MSCPYFDNNAKRYCQAPFMNELGWSRLTMPRRSGLIPMMQRRIKIWGLPGGNEAGKAKGQVRGRNF